MAVRFCQTCALAPVLSVSPDIWMLFSAAVAAFMMLAAVSLVFSRTEFSLVNFCRLVFVLASSVADHI